MKRSFRWLLLLAACTTNALLIVATSAVHADEGRSVEDRREEFRRAVELFRQGRFAEARLPFTRAASEYRSLRDHALRHLAKLTDELDGPAEGEPFWAMLHEEFPDSVWRGEAALALGRARRGQENRDEALALGREALRHLDDGDPLRPEALWFVAGLLRESGATTRARELERGLREKHGDSDLAAKARTRAWSLRKEEILTDASATREEIELLLREGREERALTLCDEALERFAGSSEVAPLSLLRASALEATAGDEAALESLRKVRSRFPKEPAGAEALFREARILWNRDDDEQARELFDRFVERHTARPEVPEARYAAARTKEAAGDCPEAVRRYEQLAAAHPSHRLAEEAEWHAGWCEYRSGRFDEAAERFGRLARRRGDRTVSSLFWQARSLERLGRESTEPETRILEQFPESVYATFVERRRGRPVASALRPRLPSTSPETGALPEQHPHVKRFHELRTMDLRDLARRELEAWTNDAGRLSGSRLGGALEAWLAVDGHARAIRIAAGAGGCRTENAFLPYCYPRGYWPVVERYSRHNGLDPYLVSSLIRQESLFDPEAVSWANARGLMQLLPSTAERVARRTGDGPVDVPDLHDAERNVRLGTAYLRTLLDRYDGNVPRALAAYNAGEAAADRWIERFPDASDDEFVELVTYRETRDYVKKVLRNLRFYRALYAPPQEAPDERTDTSD